MFGHNISFNFNNKGNFHRTLCGGYISILLRVLLLIIILTNFMRMGTSIYETSFFQQKLTEELLAPPVSAALAGKASYSTSRLKVPIGNSGVMILPTINSLKNGRKRLIYDPEMMKYIRISFVQRTIDYATGAADVLEEIPAQPCSAIELREDEFSFYGNSATTTVTTPATTTVDTTTKPSNSTTGTATTGTSSTYATTVAQTISANFLCPYQTGGYFLQGTKLDNMQLTYELQIKRCETGTQFRNFTVGCATTDQIDAYLKDIEVEIFTRTKQYNTRQLKNLPVIQSQGSFNIQAPRGA